MFHRSLCASAGRENILRGHVAGIADLVIEQVVLGVVGHDSRPDAAAAAQEDEQYLHGEAEQCEQGGVAGGFPAHKSLLLTGVTPISRTVHDFSLSRRVRFPGSGVAPQPAPVGTRPGARSIGSRGTRSAIRWLNDHTVDPFAFFAVRVRVVQIADSPRVPLFEVLERPSAWDRTVRERYEQTEPRQLHFLVVHPRQTGRGFTTEG